MSNESNHLDILVNSRTIIVRKGKSKMKTVKDVLDSKNEPLWLTTVAGSRESADDPNVKTLKYFEAQYILARILNKNYRTDQVRKELDLFFENFLKLF